MKYLILLSIYLSINLNAQLSCENPCESDNCMNLNSIQWVPQMVTLNPDPGCPQCWVEVWFKWRESNLCNPSVEFQLDYVFISGACYYPCPPDPFPHYPGFQFYPPYMDALKAIVEFLPGIEDPSIGNCIDLPNVQNVDCQKYVTVPNGDRYITYCDDPACCSIAIKYCKTSSTDYQAELDFNDIITSECDQDPDGADCFNTCNLNDYEWTFFRPLVPEIELGINIKVNENLLYLNTDNLNNIKINLIDMNGRIINSMDLRDTKNIILDNLFNNVSNGNYLVIFTQNEKHIGGLKYNLNK